MKDDHDHLVPITGERGPKGDHGQSGDLGDTGIRGIQGAMGERGDRGDRGTEGERGRQGDQGRQGDRGREGERAQLPTNMAMWMIVALFFFTIALFAVPFSSAKRIYDGQVAGCERVKTDRGLQARSWRAAHEAALATSVGSPGARRTAARIYELTALRLEARSGPDFKCTDQYPKPSLLPL